MKLNFYTVLWQNSKPDNESKALLNVDPDRPFAFGRGSECDCLVPIVTASKVHASLCCEDGQWVLHDGLNGWRSTNGIHYGSTKKDAIAISALVLADKLTSPIFIARSNGDRLELVVEWVDRDHGKDTASFDINQQLEQKLVILTAEIENIRAIGTEVKDDVQTLKTEVKGEIKALKTEKESFMKALEELRKTDRKMAMALMVFALIFIINVGDKILSPNGKARVEEIALNGLAAIVAGYGGGKLLLSKKD